jgi:hypothetical protein
MIECLVMLVVAVPFRPLQVQHTGPPLLMVPSVIICSTARETI